MSTIWHGSCGDNLSWAGRGVSVLFRVLMRKTLLCLALAGEVVVGGLLRAQDTQSPWKVGVLHAAGRMKYDRTTGQRRSKNGVSVQYQADTDEHAEPT